MSILRQAGSPPGSLPHPLILTFILALLAPSCGDLAGLLPPDISMEELLSVPDTVSFKGHTFTLHTDLWRDFMPTPDRPAGGESLMGVVYVTATDSTPLPPTLGVDAIWLVNVDKSWRSWLTNESVPEDLLQPNRVVRYLRGGPPWGPAVALDVVVRLVDVDGTSAYLRAEEQWIFSTE